MRENWIGACGCDGWAPSSGAPEWNSGVEAIPSGSGAKEVGPIVLDDRG